MKAIKLIIVGALAVALGFGIFKIINPGPTINDGKKDTTSIELPSGCDLNWIENYVDSAYKAVPDGSFGKLKTRRTEMTALFEHMLSSSDKKCKETAMLHLRNSYQSRFVEMAHKEFEDGVWPHFKDIKAMNNELSKELEQGSEKLKKIADICNQYTTVINYNSRVKQQCSQRPYSFDDKWDYDNTMTILSSTPTVSAPVDHTTQYELSKPANVKTRLYQAHVSFLELLVEQARGEIIRNTKRSNYNRVCDIVAKEIEKFQLKADTMYGKNYDTVRRKAQELNTKLNGLKKYTDE